MTTVVPRAKTSAPLLTRVVQLLGLVALIAAGVLLIGGIGCQGLDCLIGLVAAWVAGWGALALLAGLRNRIGLVCLILAVLTLFAFAWVDVLYGIAALALLAYLTRISKDRVKDYYMRRGES